MKITKERISNDINNIQNITDLEIVKIDIKDFYTNESIHKKLDLIKAPKTYTFLSNHNKNYSSKIDHYSDIRKQLHKILSDIDDN